MTNEELLIPRFKVIGDYPGNIFPIGSIVSTGCHMILAEEKQHEVNIFSRDDDFRKYPNIFHELSWDAFRKIEDMPHYIKFNSGFIAKVITGSIRIEDFVNLSFDYESPFPVKAPYVLFSSVLPATEDEFMLFTNKKIKQNEFIL